MKLLLTFTLLLSTTLGCSATVNNANSLERSLLSQNKVLGIIAHPDDETSFSATWFSISKLLGGTSDLLVITNGEGGYKYSTLGEFIYKTKLTDEVNGRAKLPAIRKKELNDAGEIIGINKIIHLNQKDDHYTKNEKEVLSGVWDTKKIKERIKKAIVASDYDAVFLLFPYPRTHGHHKAAAILTLEAIQELPKSKRPLVLGSSTGDTLITSKDGKTDGLKGYPLTKAVSDEVNFSFDRDRTFGFKNKLNFKITTAWHIAAHKSQGTIQLFGKSQYERFWILGEPSEEATARGEMLFDKINEGVEEFGGGKRL